MFTAGIPGLSAYIGLTEVAKAKAGETIGRRVMSETSRAGHVYFFRVVRKVLSDGAVSSNDSFFICPSFNPNTGGGGEPWVNPPPPPPPIILRLEWGQPWRYLFKWRDSPSCNLATLKVPLSNDAVTRTNLRVPSLTQFKLKQVYKKENVNVLFI